MPRFEPFAGLRYHPRIALDEVVAPPYDVIAPDERAELAQRSPYNAVRVELPADEDGKDRYVVARDLLTRWRREGVLVGEDQPAFYGHRMAFTDESGRLRHSLGVIGALGIDEPGAGGVLPHEHTTPKAKTDRLELLRSTSTNISPIWGLSLARGLTQHLIAPERAAGATDDDGVRHELWPITDPGAVDAIARAVASAPVVIADGHHRYETAGTYRNEHAPTAGPWDLVMALVVELADDQLSVRAIHRLLSGLPPDLDLPAVLRRWFAVVPTAPADATITHRMEVAGALALVTPEGTWLLRPSAELAAAAAQDLDSSRFDVARGAIGDHEVVYQHGWDLALRAVETGLAQAAVLLRPATVAQIEATGRGGARMPPKTTFFWPKPRTGLVMRSVEPSISS